MQTVLIVIHIMVVLALIATVLLQRSEGGALGIGGGGGFMTGRGQANVLTRATAILAAVFFATSLGLTLLANANRPSKSIFEGAVAPATAPGAPAGQGTLLQQLKKQQQELQEHPQPPGPPGQPEPPRSQ
jgi:preprotein translocase subunit SecG